MTDWFPENGILSDAADFLRKSDDKEIRKLADAFSEIERTSVGGAGFVNLASPELVAICFYFSSDLEDLDMDAWREFRQFTWDYAEINADDASAVASQAQETLDAYFAKLDEEYNENNGDE